MIIGVDPHKRSHTATAVNAVRNAAVGSLQVDAFLAGYWHLLRWARQFKDRRWSLVGLGGQKVWQQHPPPKNSAGVVGDVSQGQSTIRDS